MEESTTNEIIDPVSVVEKNQEACITLANEDTSGGVDTEALSDGDNAHDVQNEDSSTPNRSENSDTATTSAGGTDDAEGDEALSLQAELDRERARRIYTENKLLCITLLEENGLPVSLSDYLTSDSEEKTRERVRDVSKIVKDAVNQEVSRRLITIPTPSERASTMTRAEFKSLSLSDMQRLYVTDKELYKELSQKL